MTNVQQRMAYWIDIYRCAGPDFAHYTVDSFVSFIQTGVDEQGNRTGERLPVLGWSFYDSFTQLTESGEYVVRPLVMRVRGGVFVDRSAKVNSVVGLLQEYEEDISDRPPAEWDLNCAESSSSSSISQESSSYVPYGSGMSSASSESALSG